MFLNRIKIIVLLLFSAFVYTFRLGQIPPATYVDEATTVYNAYSVLTTGRDEYGEPHPFYFRLFGAYTPSLFHYLSIPLIQLFGADVLPLRFVSAICGTITVIIFYRLSTSFWLSLIFAVTPWQVFNSRLGYEVMLASTIFNLGFYLLVSANRSNRLPGLLLISLSTYAAHTQKFLAPLFLLPYFIFINRPTFKTIILLFISQIPNIFMLFTPAFWAKGTGIDLSHTLSQLIDFLSPSNLFFQISDIDGQHQIPQSGLYFWWMLPFLFLGIKNITHLKPSYLKPLIILVVAGLVPASLSGAFISVQRFLPLLLPLSLLVSLGIPNSTNFRIFLFLYSLLLVFRSYFLFLPKFQAKSWNYGYQQLSQVIKQYPETKFIIDNSRNPRNYILLLYYLKYPPILYQSSQGTLPNYYSNPVISDNKKFANLEVRPVTGANYCGQNIIVGDQLTISPNEVTKLGLKSLLVVHDPATNEILLQALQSNSNNPCSDTIK